MNDYRNLFARLALPETNQLDLSSEFDPVPPEIGAITQTLAAVIGDRNQTFPIVARGSLEKGRDLSWRECRLACRRPVFYRLDRKARIHADVALSQRPVENSRQNRDVTIERARR